jgi:hypothetical protein
MKLLCKHCGKCFTPKTKRVQLFCTARCGVNYRAAITRQLFRKNLGISMTGYYKRKERERAAKLYASKLYQ